MKANFKFDATAEYVELNVISRVPHWTEEKTLQVSKVGRENKDARYVYEEINHETFEVDLCKYVSEDALREHMPWALELLEAPQKKTRRKGGYNS